MPDLDSFKMQRIHDLKLKESLCVAAVVQVLKFDPEKMTVNVQPLSKQLENGKYESQPPILCVPVAVTHSGGFLFRPWFKPGDTGVVVYLDHDMDATVTGGKEAKPLTERNHATTDAIFVGAIVSGDYKVEGLPEESIAIAKDDGSIYVAITKDKVIVKNEDTTAEFTATSIDMKSVDMNITLGGNMTVTTGGKIFLN
jgi:hypothetical protein